MRILRSESRAMIRLQAVCLSLLLVAGASVGAQAASPIVVSDAYAPPASGSVPVYATITNSGDDADRLLGATSPSATGSELHDAAKGTAALAAIIIPAHGTVTLAAGGPYVTMTGLKAPVAANDLFFARLHFERAGWIVAIVHVHA